MRYKLEERSSVLDVYFVQGAAMLIHKDVFDKIGYFDPLYYIFFDEVDFSRRNLRVGYRIALVPTSKIRHFGSGDNNSNKKMVWRKNFYYTRNKYFFHLSDYQMNKSIRREILRKWIINDIKDAFFDKNDICGITQMLLVFLQIAIKYPVIHKKRRKEKQMERKIIIEKTIECIKQIIPEFTEENMKSDLNNDFGLDSISIMELVILIEEKFNLVFDVDVDITQLYSPMFIVKYVSEYQR